MNIKAIWHREISLKDGSKQDLIFQFPEEDLTDEAGCYVFYNRLRKRCKIIYIGRANNILDRLKGQFNSVRLMTNIKKSGKGKKVLMYCTLELKRGQQLAKALNTLEKNLINHAFSEGHELLNVHGAKIHYHEINFKGSRISESLFGRNILSPLK